MFKSWKVWSENRAAVAIQRSYRSGYDYAAGALLRREKNPAELEAQYDTADAFGENARAKAFDRGMRDAVNVILTLGFVRDNRVL